MTDGSPARGERPVLALVSTGIRRDLVAPLVHFSRLRPVHLYRWAAYGDLADDEPVGNLVRYGSTLALFLRLLRLGPHIVQGVEPFSIRLLPDLYATWAAARLRRAPLVLVTLENRPLEEKHGPALARVLRALLRPVFGYARLIIVLNDGARRSVHSVGSYEAKIRRLMYGVWGTDMREFTPERDGREPDLGPSPLLLFVGRLHEEKGVFDLLEAFGLVRLQVPGIRLALAGDGPARNELERRVVARGWAEEVLILGTVKNRDLPPYFRAATVFVAPSVTARKWEEQVGMTNIQAMACGVPVVSTRSGAIPEYVPDGIVGMLVPERAPQALAEAIVRLLRDPALRGRLGQAGRAWAAQHYDAAANVHRAEDAILESTGYGSSLDV